MDRYLVTGASRGIGRAIAIKLARPDAEILLHGRDQEALVEVYTEVETAGAAASILTYDLTDPAGINDMVARIGDAPLRAMINNAGVAVVKPFNELSLGQWQEVLAVNVTAPFLLTQKLTNQMQPGATVINILSVAAKDGFPGWSSYSMSKFALRGFSLAIREELRSRGIRVVNVYPSATATDIWQDIEGDWPEDRMLAPENVANAVAFAINQPDEVLIEDVTVTGIAGNL